MQAIHHDTRQILTQLRTRYRSHFSNLILSVGDTPTCSMLDDLSGIDEIRPGNFVFYDLMQYHIGSCSLDDIAVIMVCPVVAKQKARQELVIYGGGIHFSKDGLDLPDQHMTSYGRFVHLHKSGWEISDDSTFIRSLSQEHGVVRCSQEVFARYRPGDLIGFLPVHSCMTAECMGEYISLEGGRLDHLKAHHEQKVEVINA